MPIVKQGFPPRTGTNNKEISSVPKKLCMQIGDDTIIKWLWAAIVSIVTILGTVIWKIVNSYSSRLNAVEEKMDGAVTLTEVQIIVSDVKREFKGDHSSLDGRIGSLASRLDRVETGLRQEIHNSHDSLQGSIDKVVNILLTRDESDRRRRGE